MLPNQRISNNDNNGWLLYSANLLVKKTQCAITNHSRKYTHRHKYNLPLLHSHIMVRVDLWKCLLKKESFELGFEVRDGEIPQLEGNEFQTVGAMKLKEEQHGLKNYGSIC